MPKVAQAVLEDFGRAVKRARSLNGWTLDQLADQITPAPGKSFLSNIEKGKRDISAPTVGKLIRALDLSQDWIDRFLDADIAPEAEETRDDRATERLIRLYEKDDTAPETGETLLLLLAEDWGQKKFTDPMAAYTALKGALQVAEELVPEARTLGRALDEAGDVGDHERAALVHAHHAQVGVQRREGIVGHLGACR